MKYQTVISTLECGSKIIIIVEELYFRNKYQVIGNISENVIMRDHIFLIT